MAQVTITEDADMTVPLAVVRDADGDLVSVRVAEAEAGSGDGAVAEAAALLLEEGERRETFYQS